MGFSAFLSDAFSRRIVGWGTASSMPTSLPLDALVMAQWTPPGWPERAGVEHHTDAGSQYTSTRYTSRLVDAVASICTVGDAYDCDYPSAAAGAV